MAATMADTGHIMASSRVRMDGTVDNTTGTGRPPKGTASAKRPTVTAR